MYRVNMTWSRYRLMRKKSVPPGLRYLFDQGLLIELKKLMNEYIEVKTRQIRQVAEGTSGFEDRKYWISARSQK